MPRRPWLGRWESLIALLLLTCAAPPAVQPSVRQADQQAAPRARYESRISALDERRFGMAQVRAALYSVAYHSEPVPPDLPWPLLPIPLDEAARILKAGAKGDEFGESRRRRSVIDLALGGLEQRDGAWHVRQPNDGALAILLGKLKKPFDKKLKEILNGLPPLPPPPPDPHPMMLTIDQAKFVRLSLWDWLEAKLQVAILVCGQTVPPTSVDKTYPDGSVEVTTTLAVSGQIYWVSSALDPQNWDAINFANGKPCNPYFRIANEYVKNTGNQWVPKVCPDKPGSQWVGSLFEYFEADFEEFSSADFSTILAISRPSGNNAPTWGFDYALTQDFGGRVVAKPNYSPLNLSGDIGTDEGGLDAVKTLKDIQITAVKRIHFVDWIDDDHPSVSWTDAMNAWAVVALKAMGGVLAESACCQPLDPLPCTTGGSP